jgi:RND family efflux transporter MFP subunit
MKVETRSLRKIIITVFAAFVALWAGYKTWEYYAAEPWTRDGKIRADVVAFAPDVSGRVMEVLVHDNEQVKVGQVLFRVDTARLKLTLKRAEAAIAISQAGLSAAEREARRYSKLSGVVSEEVQRQKSTSAEQAAAAYFQAVQDRDLALINLERSEVKSPVNGIVTNFSLREGAYVTSGVPVTALIDSDSFHAAGYFEETKLRRIHIGDKAKVKVIGEPGHLKGSVESIASGIEDRERSTAAGTLLPNVNPSFSWVRLPQRIPVRIKLEEIPKDFRLVAGRTATVEILGQ